jgi:hypothetical protein
VVIATDYMGFGTAYTSFGGPSYIGQMKGTFNCITGTGIFDLTPMAP